jgi:small conductance mechanosensitive channel
LGVAPIDCRGWDGRVGRLHRPVIVMGLQEWHVARGYLVALAPRFGGAVAAAVAAWIVASLTETALNRFGTRRQLDLDVTRLLSRSAKLAIFAFGAITSLGTLGLDIKALVAGLGLTGFALGFALKDIIANWVAGILVLFYKPFRRGDRIETAGTAGRVEAINLRYTVLRADDGARVLVPNSTLFTNSIRVTVVAPTPPPTTPATSPRSAAQTSTSVEPEGETPHE